jgi:hypothetical protein
LEKTSGEIQKHLNKYKLVSQQAKEFTYFWSASQKKKQVQTELSGEMGGMQTSGAAQNNTESAQEADTSKTNENQNTSKKGTTNIVQLTSNLRDMQGMFKALNTQIKKQKDEVDHVKMGLKPDESCP